MHLSTLQEKEKWALEGLLHPCISTPSIVTNHTFNHHTPTPELSPTPSTVTPSIIPPSPSHYHPSYTLYLIVESSDPVTMTLSSYCRHPTGIVWPRSSVVMFRYSRYQICTERRVKFVTYTNFDFQSISTHYLQQPHC